MKKNIDVFFNIISLPERGKKKDKYFGNNKHVLFLNLNDKIIQQEINKMAIHTHVIFKPRNAMFFLSNTVNSALVNRARFC